MASIDAVRARIAGIQSEFKLPSSVSSSRVASGMPSFASALDHATADGAPSRPDILSSGKVQVPQELTRFGNGRIPTDALTSIGVGSHRLSSKAADAFKAMRAAASAAGVNIGVTDSYRDLATQQRLAQSKGLYSQGGLAARPGTSNHGWGLAVDVDVEPAGLAWLRANAQQFGFVEDVPREPWHWTFHQ